MLRGIFQEQNDSEENILSMGSPPRYRLTDPNRYAMFKPCPPPRPLAAKVHTIIGFTLARSSDFVASMIIDLLIKYDVISVRLHANYCIIIINYCSDNF